jgi:hypothetical protein
MAYDRTSSNYSNWYQGDLYECQRIVSDLIATHSNVLGVLWFSAMRPSGIVNHPSLAAWHWAIAGGSVGPSGSPSPSIEPPTPPMFPPGYVPTPQQAIIHPPFTDPMVLTNRETGPLSTRVWTQWFLDVARKLAEPGFALYAPGTPLPDAKRYPDGTLFYNWTYGVLYIAIQGTWYYCAGVAETKAGIIPISGTSTSPPTDPPTTPPETPIGDLDSSCSSPPSTGHPSGTSLTGAAFQNIVCGTQQEWSALRAVCGDQATRTANNTELLLRIIWHLNNYGFLAGRQKNPNGIISGNKLTCKIGGVVRAFDVFREVTYTEVTPPRIMEVEPAHYVAEAGTPD